MVCLLYLQGYYFLWQIYERVNFAIKKSICYYILILPPFSRFTINVFGLRCIQLQLFTDLRLHKYQMMIAMLLVLVFFFKSFSFI